MNTNQKFAVFLGVLVAVLSVYSIAGSKERGRVARAADSEANQFPGGLYVGGTGNQRDPTLDTDNKIFRVSGQSLVMDAGRFAAGACIAIQPPLPVGNVKVGDPCFAAFAPSNVPVDTPTIRSDSASCRVLSDGGVVVTVCAGSPALDGGNSGQTPVVGTARVLVFGNQP